MGFKWCGRGIFQGWWEAKAASDFSEVKWDEVRQLNFKVGWDKTAKSSGETRRDSNDFDARFGGLLTCCYKPWALAMNGIIAYSVLKPEHCNNYRPWSHIDLTKALRTCDVAVHTFNRNVTDGTETEVWSEAYRVRMRQGRGGQAWAETSPE